jgi:hypothetical protein
MSKNQKKLKKANHGKRPASNKARRAKRAAIKNSSAGPRLVSGLAVPAICAGLARDGVFSSEMEA